MKCAIVGGGASGLICALQTAKTAKENGWNITVTVYEKNDRVGKKLLATGNGRCNLTNTDSSIENYFGEKQLAFYALTKFPPQSNIEFFNAIGLYTRTDSEGRVYPLSNQASSVLDALRFSCESYGVNFRCGEAVTGIERKKNKFIINGTDAYDKVVVSCGSKAGVKAFNGYDILSAMGIRITETFPSLIRLDTPSALTKQLKGIRAQAVLTLLCEKKKIACEKGELLFADHALSGIAAMQLSSYIPRIKRAKGERLFVSVDFAGDFDYERFVSLLKQVRKNCARLTCESLLSGFMPKKIGTVLLKEANISLQRSIGSLNDRELKSIASLCKSFIFEITPQKNFQDCQVTAGGVAAGQFDTETLESKKIKGLYCCGEVLDVDGLCGGYNLQWAWSSGRLCAESLLSGVTDDKNQ